MSWGTSALSRRRRRWGRWGGRQIPCLSCCSNIPYLQTWKLGCAKDAAEEQPPYMPELAVEPFEDSWRFIMNQFGEKPLPLRIWKKSCNGRTVGKEKERPLQVQRLYPEVEASKWNLKALPLHLFVQKA